MPAGPRWSLTRKRRCLPSPTVAQVGQLAAGDEQVDARVAEPERREAAQLGAEAERERRAGDDRVDHRDRPQVVVGEVLVGVRGERVGERVDVLRLDREAGRGAVAAEALEVTGAGGETARGGRTSEMRPAGALPVALRAGDQDDRPAVALDQARGDDPDHALVPALARDDVAAPAAACLGPGLDRCASPRAGCAPRPPGARGSAPRAPAAMRFASSSSSVSSSSSAAVGRPRRPAALIRGASRKPTAPSSTTAASTRAACISARRPGRCVVARRRSPASASARFSSTSGTTSAIVASATRSRCARRRAVRRASGSCRAAPRRACRRRPCRRAPGTGSRTAAWRRSGSRAARRPGGGGR